MGYEDIQNREDIDGLIGKTLSEFYGTDVSVSDRYAPGAFILNPRLNTAITCKADREIKKAVRTGHTVRRNTLLNIAMNAYITVAFSKHTLFGCKYIVFKEYPDHAEKHLIMPGNMKVKIFDYSSGTVTNLLKAGFEPGSIKKERSVRMDPEWGFVLPLEMIDGKGYRESLLKGCSFDRLEQDRKGQAEKKIRSALRDIQRKGRRTEKSDSYTQALLDRIMVLLRQVKGSEKAKKSVADFAGCIKDGVRASDVEIAFSHGDFQYGNLFITEAGDLYVLDWETCEDRSIGYDILTFFYSFRYRRDYLGRIDAFLSDSGWQKIQERYYENAIDRRDVLRVYLLEDIVWLLMESCSTAEKRISDGLLAYSEQGFQSQVLERLKE